MTSFVARTMCLYILGTTLAFLAVMPIIIFADDTDTSDDEISAGTEESDNDLTLFFSGSNKMQYTDDKISDTAKFEDELAMNFGYGDFSAYFRVSNDLTFPNQTKDYEIEKGTIRWNGPDVTVTAGDFSASFAKGLALNFFEAPEVDYDTELRGGMVEANFDWVTLTALMGGAEPAGLPQNDRVQGFHTTFHIGENATIGGTYAEVEDFLGTSQGYSNTEILGLDCAIDIGALSVGAEYVRHKRDDDNPVDDGNGIIGWASYSGDNWSIYGGMYKYERILSPYAAPASFKEHPEKAFADPADEKGYGVRFTWSPDDWGSFDMNYAQSNTNERGLPYTEALFTWTLPATDLNSFILQNRYVYEIIGKENATILEWQHILNEDWSSSVTAEHVFVDDIFGVHKEHVVALGLDYDHQFSAIYHYEYAAFKIAQKNRWDKLTLKYTDPNSVYDVQLVYGSQRDGFQCTGGICQQLPEFKGVELTVNIFF